MKVVDVRDFCIPSDGNDYDELVAFADTMAGVQQFDAVPIDVLDKIRAEIQTAADKQFQIAMGVSDLNERYAHIQMENAYRHSLSVIDKYMAESEEKNDKI